MDATRTSKASVWQHDLKTHEGLLSFVRARSTAREAARNELERQWYVNVAQFLGHQYHVWSDSTRRLFLPKPSSQYRVRIVANRLMPAVRKSVARYLRQRPQWTVVPATNDMDDRYVAKVGTAALRYYWRTLEMDELLVNAFTWMSTCGNVFLRAIWDTTKGPEMSLDDEDFSGETSDSAEEGKLAGLGRRFIAGITGNGNGAGRKKKKEPQRLNLGDLCVEMRSPFEIDIDPSATCLAESSFLIDTTMRSRGQVMDEYPDAEGLESADGGPRTFYQRQLAGLTGPSGGSSSLGQANDDGDSVLVSQLWVRRCRRYPRGLFAIVSGSAVLKQGENPYEHGEIPYVHMREITVPGRFWGTCALEQGISLQASYNRLRSQWIENVNLMSRPKWMLPKGSGVRDGSPNDQPGEVVEYNYPLEPKLVIPPPMPQDLRQNMDLAISDLQEVTAQHEVSRASVPSGVRSGVAISQLQEEDESSMAPTYLLIERSLSKLGGWLLHLLAQYVEEERLIKVVGKDSEPDVHKFTGKSLVGKRKSEVGVNYFDVEVQVGSQLPHSKAARTQHAIELVQYGILDSQNPKEKEKAWEILQLGTMPGEPDAKIFDRANARRENMLLAEGLEVGINQWDDDPVHLEILRLYQKDPSYQRDLDSMEPEVALETVERFERHARLHQERLAGVLQSQQGPPGLGPPGGGGEGLAPPLPLAPPAPPGPPQPEIPPVEEFIGSPAGELQV